VRLGKVQSDAAARLAAAGFAAPRRRARRLLAAALDCDPAHILGYPERELDAGEGARIEAFLRRMLAHEPLSRILGRREFWGLPFALSAETFDPRPETESVVEAVLEELKAPAFAGGSAPFRLLDLGTGAGVLLLSLLAELPRAFGVGIDLVEGAAARARANAAALGLGARALFFVGEWAKAVSGAFDVILANPPYIPTAALAGLPPEVRCHDPQTALDGGADGLDAYRGIASDLPRLLAPGGVFACEVGEGQAAAVGDILAAAGLHFARVAPDLAGIPRAVLARLPSLAGSDAKKLVSKKLVGKRSGPV
jgi:release factor glutamine methyltransferase